MDGQGTQLLQQVGDLLGQLAQQETEPTIQRAIMGIMKQMEPLMTLVGQDDQQDMSSGLATPNGPAAGNGPGPPTPGSPPPGPGGSPMPGGPPDVGGAMSSEGIGGLDPSAGGGGEPPKTFEGAKAAAMATHRDKGHFNPHGAKGEEQETDKTKNRKKG